MHHALVQRCLSRKSNSDLLLYARSGGLMTFGIVIYETESEVRSVS